MEITVHLETQLRHVARVGKTLLTLRDGSRLHDALRAVAAQFGPTMEERLLTSDGMPQKSVLIFVNDRAVAHDTIGHYVLQEGDVLLLYPPISGG